MTDYQKYMETDVPPTSPGIEMRVDVLQTGTWPQYQIMELNLPQALVDMQEHFKTFYLSKYNGRRLQWLHVCGQCVLRAHFKSARKELSVSLLQALVLLVFNRKSELTYTELKEQIRMDDKNLRSNLLSLACGRFRVLTKTPKGDLPLLAAFLPASLPPCIIFRLLLSSRPFLPPALRSHFIPLNSSLQFLQLLSSVSSAAFVRPSVHPSFRPSALPSRERVQRHGHIHF